MKKSVRFLIVSMLIGNLLAFPAYAEEDEEDTFDDLINITGGLSFSNERNKKMLSGRAEVLVSTPMSLVVRDENGAQVSMVVCDDTVLRLNGPKADPDDFKPGDEVSVRAFENNKDAWELEYARNIDVRQLAIRGQIQRIEAGVAFVESASGTVYEVPFSDETSVRIGNREIGSAEDVLAGENVVVSGRVFRPTHMFREVKIIRILPS